MFLPVILIMIFSVSCKTDDKSTEASTEVEAVKEEPKHWSYDGETSPENWAEIEKDSSCE